MKLITQSKKIAKKPIENYKKDTPVNVRVIGDGLVLIGALVTLFVPGAKWAIAAGLVGKYISDQWGKK